MEAFKKPEFLQIRIRVTAKSRRREGIQIQTSRLRDFAVKSPNSLNSQTAFHRLRGPDFSGEIEPMPRVCHFTGKKTSFGNQITHRGKAKYLGGVGTKVTGITARKFRPNIQKVRAVVNGRIVRIKVSTKAIRNGLIQKPV